MALPISSLLSNSIPQVNPADILRSVGSAAQPGQSGGFASMLQGAIQSVDQSNKTADQAVQSFLNGDNEELHTVALATQKASLTFDLGLQIRNKIVSAYQEVMKMQM
jgi:flagellar hook-basal body complex protein FliE